MKGVWTVTLMGGHVVEIETWENPSLRDGMIVLHDGFNILAMFNVDSVISVVKGKEE